VVDDYDNNAHKALTGNNKIGSRFSLKQVNNQKEYTETANAFLGQGCKISENNEKNVKSYDCGKDQELVGYDTHGCKGDKVSLCHNAQMRTFMWLTDDDNRGTRTGNAVGQSAVPRRHA